MKKNSKLNGIATEPECVPRQMTIVVLGSPASGKTQIIRQFVECSFTEAYRSTKHRRVYYTSVGLNERAYQLAIMDLPFTSSSSNSRPPKAGVQEWESIKGEVDAYILLFDLTCEDSFSHLRKLRDQMGDALHLSGAGNAAGNGSSLQNGHANASTVPLIVVGNKYDSLFQTRGHLTRRYLENVNMIKKQWKWPFVECSAKHNWQVQHAFETLIKMIDTQYYGNSRAGILPGVLRRSRCVIC